eukprot:1456408-Amphidinium_carterae.1
MCTTNNLAQNPTACSEITPDLQDLMKQLWPRTLFLLIRAAAHALAKASTTVAAALVGFFRFALSDGSHTSGRATARGVR